MKRLSKVIFNFELFLGANLYNLERIIGFEMVPQKSQYVQSDSAKIIIEGNPMKERREI